MGPRRGSAQVAPRARAATALGFARGTMMWWGVHYVIYNLNSDSPNQYAFVTAFVPSPDVLVRAEGDHGE